MKTSRIKPVRKLSAIIAAFTTLLLAATHAWAVGSTTLVIAEVYGGGGNASATYQNDFAVIFNRSASSVNMSGYTIQYTSATGSGTWLMAALTNATIPAGGYYLVKMNSNAAVGSALPTADSTNNLALAAGAGKIALVNNTTALSGANPVSASIVDLVGYGTTATGYEGSGPAIPNLTSTTSAQRGSQGCTDTDNNSADFTAALPNPRNSLSATHSCSVTIPPTGASISPSSINANAGTTASFTVTLATGDTPLTYYWYKETGLTTNLIATLTSATFNITNVLAANAASYQVIVSNASTFTATSSVVTLTVVDPAINTQPKDLAGLLNGTAYFTVSAAGTGLGYRWYQGQPDPALNSPYTDGGRISGSTTSTLAISGLLYSDATNLFVIVTNSTGGAVTSSVVALTVVNSGTLAYWDFNAIGTSPSNPAPASASTTTSSGVANLALTNSFIPASGNGSPNDPITSVLGATNYYWGTSTYPLVGESNKTAGVFFKVNTAGMKNINLTFDTRPISTTSKYERLQYTTNGTDYIDYPSSSQFGSLDATTWHARTFSLVGFAGVNNNPNFGVRIVTEFESTATYGASNTVSYVGVSSAYSSSATLSYDIVNFTADSVTNANVAPVIGTVTNLTIQDGLSGNENFTITDDSTSAGSLTVSATSLNPNVSPSIGVTHVGNNFQLQISSSLGNSTTNSAPILITATDANGDSSSAWFMLTIKPANSAPVLAGIISTNMLTNSVLVIPFTVSDDLTPAGSINVSVSAPYNSSLLPNDVSHIALGGSGSARTLTLTPVAGQSGTVPLTISAMDDVNTTATTIYLTVRENTNSILVENFKYDTSGALTAQSGGFWSLHSGSTPNQLQCNNAGFITIDSVNNGEDDNAPLIGAPYPSNTTAVLYAKFNINYKVLPDNTGAYFAHFKDATTFGFFARTWASTLNATTPGSYRISIGNSSSSTASTAQFPQDLLTNVNYTVVTRLAMANGVSTVWVNPTSAADPGVTAFDSTNSLGVVTNLAAVTSFAFRESNASGGALTVSNLVVGTSFSAVTGLAPVLSVSSIPGNKVVLTWTENAYGLQAATFIDGAFTNVPGATSPFTNTTTVDATKFYRLKK